MLKTAASSALSASLVALAVFAGCASSPAAPGSPGYPSQAASWTAALASAGDPAELVTALADRVEAALGEIRAVAPADRAVSEAAGRALLNLARGALLPAARGLASAPDAEPDSVASIRERLSGLAGSLADDGAELGLPALREAAASLGTAAEILADAGG